MSINQKIFSGTGQSTDDELFVMDTNECVLLFGAVGADSPGSGVDIQIVTAIGGRHTLFSFTALSALENNSINVRYKKGTKIGIKTSGAANLYVEKIDIDPREG